MLLHALRAPIGVKILADTSAGIIPPLFGDRAGPGDVAVGVLALAAAAALPALTRFRRAMVAGWCFLGMADLALAFGTGQYLLFVVRAPRMVRVGELAYAHLPTLVVPLMILTRLLVLTRLVRSSSPGEGAARAPRQ